MAAYTHLLDRADEIHPENSGLSRQMLDEVRIYHYDLWNWEEGTDIHKERFEKAERMMERYEAYTTRQSNAMTAMQAEFARQQQMLTLQRHAQSSWQHTAPTTSSSLLGGALGGIFGKL